MRSLLFVPGDSPRKQLKALEGDADVLILDLEDSVAAAAKPDARAIVREFVTAHRDSRVFFVRVNNLTTGLTDMDLAAVMPARPHGIMLPKASHADDVTALGHRLRALELENGAPEGATRILPIITETALGVLNASTHARPNPRCAGLTWGAEDLSASIGAATARNPGGRYTDLFLHARTMTLLTASAAGVPAVDTVYPDFRDTTGFARDCAEAACDGFTARMAIHPAQVTIINAAFTPTTEEVEIAQAVVEAFEAAGDAGVIAIAGKMYDRPHLRMAERLLARANVVARRGVPSRNGG